SHDGDDDDLGFFVGGGEAFVEGFEGGTVTACAEGGHVEDVTDRHPTTIDAAVSLELSAVEIIWCKADEGGDLFAAHLPQFWQQGDEREGQHGADAWHRGQQLIALSESTIGGNQRTAVSSLPEQSSESTSIIHSTPIALPLVMSPSVSPDSRNMARWKL